MKIIFAAIGFIFLQILSAQADAPSRLSLSELFAEGAVLQRDHALPIWGTAAPGTSVYVHLADHTVRTRTDKQGRWRVSVPAISQTGPHVLQVKQGKVVLQRDVLIGEVWLCSGQSNMFFPVRDAINAGVEIAAANDADLRLFTVARSLAYTPSTKIPGAGKWQQASPETVSGFSAACYFFGRDLRQKLGVPVGLIHASWGGTVAEAWTSADALAPLPWFKEDLSALAAHARNPRIADNALTQAMEAWWTANDPVDVAEWSAFDFDDSAWLEISATGKWQGNPLGAFDGIVWLRSALDLPQDWHGLAATLRLGMIDDRDTVWVNGIRVGASNHHGVSRSYAVPAGVLRVGRNVVTVRVLDSGGTGGLALDEGTPTLTASHRALVVLSNVWRAKLSADLKNTTPVPKDEWHHPNIPSVLYNGMIAPLAPISLRGVVWYQGESNRTKPERYETLLETLITDWRKGFQPDLDFVVIQLANYLTPHNLPQASPWAEIREAQRLVSQKLDHVALVTTIDIGDEHDIHPRNKQEVGRRAALAALRLSYGDNTAPLSPHIVKAEREQGRLRLIFAHVDAGWLSTNTDIVNSFTLCDAGANCRWAEPRIDGASIMLTLPGDFAATEVRFAWADNPQPVTLYSRAGLPLTPFRLPIPTVPSH
jgi:sialate O-acetylesterase